MLLRVVFNKLFVALFLGVVEQSRKRKRTVPEYDISGKNRSLCRPALMLSYLW